MLASNVSSYIEAYHWLDHYRRHYDVYYDRDNDETVVFDYIIVRETDACNGTYRAVH